MNGLSESGFAGLRIFRMLFENSSVLDVSSILAILKSLDNPDSDICSICDGLLGWVDCWTKDWQDWRSFLSPKTPVLQASCFRMRTLPSCLPEVDNQVHSSQAGAWSEVSSQHKVIEFSKNLLIQMSTISNNLIQLVPKPLAGQNAFQIPMASVQAGSLGTLITLIFFHHTRSQAHRLLKNQVILLRTACLMQKFDFCLRIKGILPGDWLLAHRALLFNRVEIVTCASASQATCLQICQWISDLHFGQVPACWLSIAEIWNTFLQAGGLGTRRKQSTPTSHKFPIKSYAIIYPRSADSPKSSQHLSLFRRFGI